MRIWKFLLLVLLAAGPLALGDARPLAAGDKKPGPEPMLVITDASGKEHKVKTWKFTAGTRHLSWLAEAPAEEKKEDKDKDEKGKDEKGKKGKQPVAKGKVAIGPEALEFSAGT